MSAIRDFCKTHLATASGKPSAKASAGAGTLAGPEAPEDNDSPVLQSIEVSPSNASIAGGGEQQFSATGAYSDDSSQEVTNDVEWSSSAPDVIAIDNSGYATAQLVSGTATITATDADTGIGGSTEVTVDGGNQPQPDTATLQSITISPDSATLAVGDQQQFSATGQYADGSSQDISSAVEWSPSVPGSLSIDASGLATAGPEAGDMSLTATDLDSGINATIDITVTGGEQPDALVLQSITITPDAPTMAGGGEQQFTATGEYSDGSSQEVTSVVTWSSSAQDVLAIDNTGYAYALKLAGTATVTATDADTGVAGSTDVTVEAGDQPDAPVLQSITISFEKDSMDCDEEQQLTATGDYSDGSSQDMTDAVDWVSSAPDIVVVESSGKACAQKAAGPATISATDADSGVTASTKVTVKGATPPSPAEEKTKAALQEALSKKPPDKKSLKKLVDGGGGKALDDLVKKLPDPPDRATVTAAIESRFGIKMDDTDPTKKDPDVAEGSKSIKQIYLTMLKVPEADVRNNPSLKEIDRIPTTTFPYYQSKKAVLPAFRTDLPGNAIGNTTDRTDKDGKVIPAELADVDEDCKPTGPNKPTYLDWSTLHEVAHAVDDKKNIMGGKGGNAYADWKAPTLKEVAKAAAASLKYDAAYIEAALKGKPPAKAPAAPKGTDAATWENLRKAAVEWCNAVRVGSELWEKAAECSKRAIDGRVYHESYPNAWVSYKLEARKQGITGYQFRAAGEWFAELYAAFYSNKLKPSHPHVAWLKKVQA